MAEREGFEPPIPLRVYLISSQTHSTSSAISPHYWPQVHCTPIINLSIRYGLITSNIWFVLGALPLVPLEATESDAFDQLCHLSTLLTAGALHLYHKSLNQIWFDCIKHLICPRGIAPRWAWSGLSQTQQAALGHLLNISATEIKYLGLKYLIGSFKFNWQYTQLNKKINKKTFFHFILCIFELSLNYIKLLRRGLRCWGRCSKNTLNATAIG